MPLVWKSSIAELGNELARRAQRIPDVVFDVGTSYAKRMEDTAKEIAPWEDQTTAARAGLTGTAVREGDNTVVQVYHTVEDYGVVLETGSAPHEVNHPGTAPRPSIMPAIQQHQTEMFETAGRAVMAALGG
jgi:hypothetical protein